MYKNWVQGHKKNVKENSRQKIENTERNMKVEYTYQSLAAPATYFSPSIPTVDRQGVIKELLCPSELGISVRSLAIRCSPFRRLSSQLLMRLEVK